MIRRAGKEDIAKVAAIYDAIIDKEAEKILCVGWQKGVYPTAETAEQALERRDLFVMEQEGEVVAAAIINRVQVPAYEDCSWAYEVSPEEVMVLHTLVVNPAKAQNGYGKTFVEFYESYAREQGSKSLRMDTNAKNTIARKFYKKLGYSEPGIVDCVFNGIKGVQLVCLEKNLEKI